MTSGDVVTVDKARMAALGTAIRVMQAQLAQLAAEVDALASGLATPTPIEQEQVTMPRYVVESVPPSDLLPPDYVWTADDIPAFHRRAEPRADTGREPANGVDINTSRYLRALTAEDGTKMARERPDSHDLTQLHKQKSRSTESHLGVLDGIDPDDLASSRWAVVINAKEPVALLRALTPLIQHRARAQGIALDPAHLSFTKDETCGEWYGRMVRDAREHGRRWMELPPVLIYRAGADDSSETAAQWLARHGVSMGPVDPRRGVPFYLMLAGRPGPLYKGDCAYIPFDFQYQLDQFWGVGRVCFTGDDGSHNLQGYTTYAERVAAFEQRPDAGAQLRKEIVYFGTKHPDDLPTTESAEQLISPLAIDWHPDTLTGAVRFGYGQRLFLGDGAAQRYRNNTIQPGGSADRDSLGRILGGNDDGRPPAIFFLASHGAGLTKGTVADYMARQGALLCQGWQGEDDSSDAYWFTAADLSCDAKVEGMVAVLFACFGAGSPDEDQFVFDASTPRPKIAPFPFVASLPQQLLLNGSLAVLGHVDRAWTYSFQGAEHVSRQSQPFEQVLSLIAGGRRLGFATDQFNLVQSARSSDLAQALEDMKFGKQIPPYEVTQLWKARNDARNYVLIGDPAVRLPYGTL